MDLCSSHYIFQLWDMLVEKAKQRSFTRMVPRTCTWHTPRVLLIQGMLKGMQTSRFEECITGLESSLDEIVKEFWFHQERWRYLYLQEIKWERWDIFLILCVDDISLIGNDVFLLDTMEVSLKCVFNERTKTKTVFSIKMYEDRLRSQIRLSQST